MRIPYLSADELDDPGQALWNEIVTTRKDDILTPSGGLAGPFNPWLYSPAIGSKLVSLGGDLRFSTTIDRRLVELAIVTVGVHWQAEFEWFIHSNLAREQGIDAQVLTTLAAGGEPEFDRPDERVVHAVVSRIMATGHIDDDLFGEAVGLLGQKGLVDLICLCGYYTVVSLTLNVFESDLPDGVEPQWRETHTQSD